jgi:hypothetical protein
VVGAEVVVVGTEEEVTVLSVAATTRRFLLGDALVLAPAVASSLLSSSLHDVVELCLVVAPADGRGGGSLALRRRLLRSEQSQRRFQYETK